MQFHVDTRAAVVMVMVITTVIITVSQSQQHISHLAQLPTGAVVVMAHLHPEMPTGTSASSCQNLSPPLPGPHLQRHGIF